MVSFRRTSIKGMDRFSIGFSSWSQDWPVPNRNLSQTAGLGRVDVKIKTGQTVSVHKELVKLWYISELLVL